MEAEFTTSYDLGSEKMFQLQGIGHGGGSEEMVRDHARQREVEGNPRRYRRWPLRASNLPGPLSRCSFSSLSRIFSKRIQMDSQPLYFKTTAISRADLLFYISENCPMSPVRYEQPG